MDHVPARSTTQRGPAPRFTQGQIVAAAREILDHDGREALSIRSLAAKLGVTPMAIYRYFADKDELLDAVIADVLSPAAAPGDPAQPWHEQLAHSLRDFHNALQRSRATAELLALSRPGRQLDPLRERLFAITALTDMNRQEADDALRALTSYALGFALATTTGERAQRHAASRASFEYGLELILASLRDRFRAL